MLAVADHVPNLDVKPSCHQPSDWMNAADCLRDEQMARDMLSDQWPRFTAQDKARCAEETKLDGNASYIQLLTCLLINASARKVVVPHQQGSR